MRSGRIAFACLLILMLAACASVPLSTAMRLSSMSDEDVARIDPSQVRVRLSVPAGFEMDVARTRLELSTQDEQVPRSAVVHLVELHKQQETRPGGLFSKDVAVLTYELGVSPEGVQQIRVYQQKVAIMRGMKFHLNVAGELAVAPAGVDDLTIWIDIKPGAAERYLPLFDGAHLRINEEIKS